MMRNLLSSQWGRAFEALRDSPIATDAMGVGTYRHKVAAFAFGSGLGGIAGALYAFNFQYLQPQSFVYELTVVLLLGVVLGGRKSLWGAVVGAALVALLPNLLSNPVLFRAFAVIGFAIAASPPCAACCAARPGPSRPWRPVVATGVLLLGSFLQKNTEDWRKAIFALMLFSVVVGLPEGLMGFAAQALARLFRVAPPPLPPAAPLDEVLPARRPRGEPLLEVRGLQRHFGGVKAVDGVDLTVHAGTIHGLIGPNGSGKSTLVNVVSGLYTPTRRRAAAARRAAAERQPLQGGAGRGGPHLPEPAALHRHDRRWRTSWWRCAAPTGLPLPLVLARPRRAPRSGRPRPRRWPSSSWWASAARPAPR